MWKQAVYYSKQRNKGHVYMKCTKSDIMTLGESRRRVAKEGETSRAASSPAAIMRTGSRVYRSPVT